MVKSEKFSEIMQRAINAYLNGMLTNEEVIAEMLKLAKQLAEAHKEGEQLGLTADELAFYDALTKPQAIKDFYVRIKRLTGSVKSLPVPKCVLSLNDC